MDTRRTFQRIGIVCASSVLAVAASCRDATEVTLVLTTDVACSMLKETAIVLGSSDDAVSTKSPVAVTTNCTSTGAGDQTIGTFVVVPDSGGSSSSFSVRVVSAVGKAAAADCTSADNFAGCIVALRDLSFIPHTSLTLPIEMRLDCEGVVCGSMMTCDQGVCKSDVIDPKQCETNCSQLTLPDGSADTGEGDEGASSGGPHETGTSEDAATEEEPPAETSVMPPDAMDDLEATTMDVGALDAPPDSSVDTGIDAKPDASQLDATADSAAMDSAVFDGSQSDGNPVGVCLAAGSSAGVACGGGTCSSSDVCCIQVSGSTVTEACSAAAACNTTSTSPVYSSFQCRNVGDCPSGKVCCSTASSTVGGSVANTCQATCPSTFAQKTACTNDCECTTGTCKEVTCSSVVMATCGGFCP